MSLSALGWCPFFEEAYRSVSEGDRKPARVAVQHRGSYEVWTEDGVLTAEVSGRFRHQAPRASDYPAVGDWVVIEPILNELRATIHAVLPRRTKFSRTAAGVTTEEQVLAANIDEVFITESLAIPPNLRRIERFLTLAWESGATPTVVLTKADLAEKVQETLDAVSALTKGGVVLCISCMDESGISSVKQRLHSGQSVALLGPSGAGKSTLINHLAQEELQPVIPVRESDQKGRHTTTCREMIFLSGGAILIDTPGLRELQLWEGGEGLDAAFTDIETIGVQCRFTNCRHKDEPHCAVRKAVQEGVLNERRLAAYQKLRGEVTQFSQRHDERVRADEQRRSKGVTRSLRGKPFDTE